VKGFGKKKGLERQVIAIEKHLNYQQLEGYFNLWGMGAYCAI